MNLSIQPRKTIFSIKRKDNPKNIFYNENLSKVSNKISFSARNLTLSVDGKTRICQTELFRDINGLNFMINHIKTLIKEKETIKILDGACSTGEETFTIAMMLKKFFPDYKGFDLIGFDCPKAIEEAKSGLIVQENDPLSVKLINFIYKFLSIEEIDLGLSLRPNPAYSDLLDEYLIEESSLFKKNLRYPFSKQFKVSENIRQICKFKVGDILKLDELMENSEKADVILFRNAMYHFTTENVLNGLYRVSVEDNKLNEVMNLFIQNVSSQLLPKGLLIFGDNELLQMAPWHKISKMLQQNGFKPVAQSQEFCLFGNFNYVWQKQ